MPLLKNIQIFKIAVYLNKANQSSFASSHIFILQPLVMLSGKRKL